MDKIIQPSLSPISINFDVCKYDRTALRNYSIYNGSYGTQTFTGSYFVPIYDSTVTDPTTTITRFLISFNIYDNKTKIEQWKLDFGDGETFIGSKSVQSKFGFITYASNVSVNTSNEKTTVTGSGFNPAMVNGILNVNDGFSYTISEYTNNTTLVLVKGSYPNNDTYNASSITYKGIPSDASSIPVINTSEFPSSGMLLIDNEYMSYVGKTSNTLTNVTRAAVGTTATYHSGDAIIKLVNEVVHQYQYDGGNNINASLAASLTAVDTRGRRIVSRKMVYPRKSS